MEEGWWEPPPGPPPLWYDEEERAKLLESVEKDKERTERIAALLELRGKVMDAENREEFYRDEEVRKAIIMCARGPDPDAPEASLYNAGPEIPDEGVRMCALSCLIHLGLSVVNRKEMVDDPAVCEVLFMGVQAVAADQDQSFELRQRGWLTLTGAAVAGACSRNAERGPPHGGSDMLDALLTALPNDLPAYVRSGVLGTIWSICCMTEVDPALLWNYEPLREAVVTCATPGEASEVRENALGLLWALASWDCNRDSMWEDEKTRDVLLESASATYIPKPPPAEEEEEEDELAKMFAEAEEDDKGGEGDEAEEKDKDGDDGDAASDASDKEDLPDDEDYEPDPVPQTIEIRCKALSAICCIANEKLLRETMWGEQKLGSVLIECAAPTEPLVVRSAALSALVQLSLEYENQLPMYGSGVHGIFATAADDNKLSRGERHSLSVSKDRIIEGAEWAAALAAERAADDAARAEAERLAAEEAARLEAERIENERVEAERLAQEEADRIAAEEAALAAEKERRRSKRAQRRATKQQAMG